MTAVEPRPALGRDLLGVEVHHDVRVPMRDGVHLSADVYLPADTPAPALVLRTPYNKRVGEFEGYAHPSWYARHGFAVVCQDVRGTYESEGTLRPFHQEAEDGYDTIEWVAAQPWCDGAVGTYGFSYPGATQLLAATQSPPHLRAIAPAMTGSNYHEGWTYHGGALQLAFVLSWAAGLGRDQAVRAGDAAAVAAFDAILSAPYGLYARLPVRDALPPELARYAPFLREWLEHPDYDDYWRAVSPKERYDAIEVPGLHVAGWYDVFLEGTLENFSTLRRRGVASQSLIVGPWYHMPWAQTVGACDFGPEARNLVDDAQIRFFRRTLKGEDVGEEAPVRLFVMGENRWREYQEWPPPARDRLLYLRSDGRAGSVNGTGALSPEQPPAGEPADVWASDANLPVMSLGGRSASSAALTPMGPADQQPEEIRNDLLVYTSAALDRPLVVIGVPTATVFAACDGPGCDVVVRLVDVHPDGTAINVSDGNVRIAWDGEPSVRELAIRMSPTAIRFDAGHRIRLEIAGSSFPVLDRHPGWDVSPVAAGPHELRVVTQIVCHDAARPSRLSLPVVD
ncbi:CocE/NonD family hydrolase [Planosporangium flavigriseum]|uniref:Putative peptidase n=1 Tax=Planosporangium flavigriseum TaxID=373681 RepID=A0A8J3LKF1_9ACTN|nr:CocE/NonD family hydrolase [Planosporangium flavigriseum]NJC66574.1 CocE/NonD family hydrolase [Planosporangium flavigriseum]GIG73447.1 putative peptidase [Planosporangium flavigriseum]